MTSPFLTLPRWLGLASGHYWTLASFVTRSASPPCLTEPESFSVTVDSDLGLPVTLRGALHRAPGAPGRQLLVLIHGLGGSADSNYMLELAEVAARRGLSVLRLSLRGADEHGWDFYHAGLTSDILRVLESSRVGDFEHVYVLGVSLGGHATLRVAGEAGLPSRVRAVAAVCPPLDLEASSAAFDAPSQWLYRRHILSGLKAMYRRFSIHTQAAGSRTLAAVAGRDLPSWEQASAIERIQDWDKQIVAPRHGFASARAYYHSQRVSTRLHEVRVPSLLMTTRWDPLVPHTTTAPAVADAEPLVSDSRWNKARVNAKLEHWELASGGHVAWPQLAPPERSVLDQLLDWLTAPRGQAPPSSQ